MPARISGNQLLVTGGAGFIGAHLVEHLLAEFPAARVTVVDSLTYAGDMSRLNQSMRSGRVTFVHGDVADQETVAAAMRGMDIVFHLAAESHVSRSFLAPGLFDRTNRLGTAVVMQSALKAGVRLAVHVSTDEVYGTRFEPADERAPLNPSSPYAVSKAEAEAEVLRARRSGLDARMARPSNIVGTAQHSEKLLPKFLGLCLSSQPFQLEGCGNQLRTFLPVTDFCAAVVKIVRNGARNGTYNICGRETKSVREVAALIAEKCGRKPEFLHIEDRPVNDRAYAMDARRMEALGWRQEGSLGGEIDKMIALHPMAQAATPSIVPQDRFLERHAGPVQFHVPHRARQERNSLDEAMSAERFSGGAEKTEWAERALEKLTGAHKVWLTHSCTGAMEIAALALDLRPGDEVIVPSFTFCATATAFARTGARLVFCDIDPATMMMDAQDLKRRITNKTAAVAIVHYGGAAADMAKISAICAQRRIHLIEDAAQAVGVTLHGRALGTFGLFGAMSFHDTKVIHCGQGGALLVNSADPALLSRVESIMNRGTDFARMRAGLTDYYEWTSPGSSFRVSEYQAAILCAQLNELDQVIAERKKLADRYHEKLGKFAAPFRLLRPGKGVRSNHHIIGLMLEDERAAADLLARLKAHGVNAQRHYAPLNISPEAKRRGEMSACANAEASWRRLVRLPIHTAMSVSDVDRVADCVLDWVAGQAPARAASAMAKGPFGNSSRRVENGDSRASA